MFHFNGMSFYADAQRRTGLAEVRELVFRPPGTDDD